MASPSCIATIVKVLLSLLLQPAYNYHSSSFSLTTLSSGGGGRPIDSLHGVSNSNTRHRRAHQPIVRMTPPSSSSTTTNTTTNFSMHDIPNLLTKSTFQKSHIGPVTVAPSRILENDDCGDGLFCTTDVPADDVLFLLRPTDEIVLSVERALRDNDCGEGLREIVEGYDGGAMVAMAGWKVVIVAVVDCVTLVFCFCFFGGILMIFLCFVPPAFFWNIAPI